MTEFAHHPLLAPGADAKKDDAKSSDAKPDDAKAESAKDDLKTELGDDKSETPAAKKAGGKAGS